MPTREQMITATPRCRTQVPAAPMPGVRTGVRVPCGEPMTYDPASTGGKGWWDCRHPGHTGSPASVFADRYVEHYELLPLPEKTPA